MSNSAELTFKDLQMDERYKRLERTLKMALLKNAESRTMENGTTGAWPSISSITGDNLDMSCAAMSSRSSRIGSEVIASSSNMRNLLHKKILTNPRESMATSSEMQFPGKKDNDSVMMPPPRTSGLVSGRPKRSESEKQRTPLLNVSSNLDRKEKGFAMSTPLNSNPSVSHSPEFADKNPIACIKEQKDYNTQNYKESRDNNQRNRMQERVFSRWRVLLTDKSQLIIKGTLECGKIARSKPVIRRLSATSVQSIFKHTYHLQGNLIDERNELPDYVSGKFCNGFPDDWENVYQMWRNFVSDGSRLSFRWPTPITDSDDDIKSGITEISYFPRFQKHTKSRSPRKRARCSKPLSPIASTSTNKENQVDKNQCVCSHVTAPVPGNSLETSIKSMKSLSNNSTTSVHSSKCGDGDHKNRSLHNISAASCNTTQKIPGNPFTDIIQEDKLNLILNTLADKNCSLAYIQKIMEMLECMKYVISYQTGSNNTETNVSINGKESYTPKATNEPLEEKIVRGNTGQYSENLLPENTTEKQTVPRNLSKSRRDQGVRRKLSKEDYDSTESENDYYETRRRGSINARSHEKTRKSHRYQNCCKLSSSTTKTKSIGASREFEKFTKPGITRDSQSELSLSEDEFLDERNNKKGSREKVMVSSRKPKIRVHEFRGVIDNRDSSVSFTEEEHEECYNPRAKASRKEKYDSSVSVTEDERGEIQIERTNVEKFNYSSKTMTRPVQSEIRRIIDTKDVQKSLLKYHNEPNCSSIDLGIDRTSFAHRIPVKTPTIERSTTMNADNQTNKSCEDNFSREQQKVSTDLSLDLKRQKIPNTVRSIVETESHKSCSDDRSNEVEFQQIRNNAPLSPTETKIQKKKPVVINSEPVTVDIRKYNRTNTKNGIENCTNANSTARKYGEQVETNQSMNEAKNLPNNQKNSAKSITERVKITKSISNAKSPKKGTNVKYVDDEAETEGTKLVKEKSMTISAEKSSLTKYGSENKPKQLTGWVPAVICKDDENSKCCLVFEGKLLNEAGHVANRKFTTDFVERRINAKLVRTVSNVHYELIGDLIDTKQVVPKELVKLCRAGCPSNINRFCEKWKVLSAGNNETPSAFELHSTSVDCLSVPTSSRGRRILPPLNYWTGERVATKDNQAVYSPGNSKELSVTTSFDKSLEEEKYLSKGHIGRSASGANKKDATKGSPPVASKSSTIKSLRRQESPKKRTAERRLAKKKHDSSSGSAEDEPKVKTALRRKKTRTNDVATKDSTTSKRVLRNISKNTTSSQSLEQSSSSSDSFKKPAEMEPKLKQRKRQKLHQDEAQTVVAGTSKQLTPRGSSGITCAFYKNVPLHGDDLSEDQLSTM